MPRAVAILVLLACVPLLPACGGDREPDLPRHRVHVLALDGADLDIVRGLVAAGRLPNFARVLAEGASGGLLSEAPRHAPVVWTTVATGRPAREHGVDELVVADRAANRLRPVASHMRRTEALWDIASAGDREVRVTGWPGTWPPEPVNGTLVPDRFHAGVPENDLLVHPGSLKKTLLSRIRRPGDLRLRFVIPRRDDPRVRALAAALAVEETRRGVADAIGTNADLVVRWSAFPGAVSHLFMGAASPKRPSVSPEEFEHNGQAVVGVYDYVDDVLGRAIGGLGQGAVLLVVSPYGFRHGVQRPATDPAPGSCDSALQHRPRGFVLAFGDGVRPGARIGGARAIDIVPTALRLLGLPGARDLGGRYLSEAFLDDRPGPTVPTWETGRYERQLSTIAGTGEERKALLAQFPELAWIGSATRLRGPLEQAIIALSVRDSRVARRLLETAIEKTPDVAVLHGLLGDLYLSVRNEASAEEAWREAIRLDPGETAWRARLARFLGGADRNPEALTTIDAAIAVEPTDPGLHGIRGDLLLKAGRAPAGIAALARAVELEPDDVPNRMRLGTELLARGAPDGAEEQFREILRLDPFIPSVWNNLGVALIRRIEGLASARPGTPGGTAREDAVASARQALDEAIRRFPDYARAWFNRATLNRLAGDRAAALRDVRKACELDPDYGAARQLRKALE